MIKECIRHIINKLGYDISKIVSHQNMISGVAQRHGIPDHEFYLPLFSPWRGYGEFSDYYHIAKSYTLVSPDHAYVLFTMARQAGNLNGAWVECGVYKGGSAMMLTKLIVDKKMDTHFHLFDTFIGMPSADSVLDIHKKGDFSDVEFENITNRIQAISGEKNVVTFHRGFIPDTFEDCGINKIAFAHVDVDIYQSVYDCCSYIYPRLLASGIIVFDDYGFPTCPGARKAVDDFFADKPEVPFVLGTGQVIVFKSTND